MSEMMTVKLQYFPSGPVSGPGKLFGETPIVRAKMYSYVVSTGAYKL